MARPAMRPTEAPDRDLLVSRHRDLPWVPAASSATTRESRLLETTISNETSQSFSSNSRIVPSRDVPST